MSTWNIKCPALSAWTTAAKDVIETTPCDPDAAPPANFTVGYSGDELCFIPDVGVRFDSGYSGAETCFIPESTSGMSTFNSL